MLLAAWRSLVAHKLRLALSTLAIMLAVAFVSGSFVFTHLLSSAFTNLVKGTLADVNVALEGTYSQDLSRPINQNARLSPVNLTAISGVAGVESVTGIVTVFNAYPIDSSGSVIGSPGAPAVASNWVDAPTAEGGRGIVLRSGHEPRTSDEVVVDPATLEKSGHKVGDKLEMSLPIGKVSRIIVGTAEWGDAGGTLGATYLFFTTAEAQALFTGGEDVYLVAWVEAKPGVDKDALAKRVGAVLPAGFEATTADAAAESSGAQINENLGFLNTFLLVFAGIAVLVASFLIVNTFNILVAQRSRELALLRAVGAKRCQVQGSVLFEAGVVGLVAASGGLVLGLGLAWLIKAIVAAIGLDLGTIAPTLTWQAVAASYGVGLVVTVIAAVMPAIRASRVPPVAAMAGDGAPADRQFGVLSWVGLGVLTVGVVAVALGAWVGGPATWWLIGVGAVFALVGTSLAAPVVGRPLVQALGSLFRRTNGDLGMLAERNTVRQPRRLAATASALTIGLALVTTIAVLGASAQRTLDASVREGLRGDLQVSSVTLQPFPGRIASSIVGVEGVAAVHRLTATPAVVGDESVTLSGMAESSFDKVLEQTMVTGHFPTGANEIMISEYRAERSGWKVGQVIAMAPPAGQPRDLTIVGMFTSPAGVRAGSIIANPETFATITPVDSVSLATVDLASGADAGVVRDRIQALLEGEPTVAVTNTNEWAELQIGQVSRILNLLYALLGLALVIAALGVVNTLGLAVVERTREIGLLRAIGLTRRQLRRVITYEAIMITSLGAVLGVALGLLFGVAIRQAAASDGLSHLAIPWLQVVVFLVLAGVIGVLAAVWPARRAARLDVLAAIATD